MITEAMLNALSSVIYTSRLAMEGGTIDTDDKRIRASGLYREWVAGAYSPADIRNANGQTWECYQAHDNAVYPDIHPDNAAWFTFWRPLHGTSPETARPFVHPTHSMDIYRKGEYMIWTDGTLMRCKEDTAYSPDEYAAAWEAA